MALICIFIFAHNSLSYIQLRLALEVPKDTEKEQELEKLEISSLKYTGGGTSPEALLEAPAHTEAGPPISSEILSVDRHHMALPPPYLGARVTVLSYPRN